MVRPSRVPHFVDAPRACGLTGAAWGLVASTCALWALASLGLGWPSPVAALSVGRMLAAALQAGTLGAVSLSLAAGWLRFALAPSEANRRPIGAWASVLLWNVGVAITVGSDLAFGASSEPLTPPLAAGAVLWIAALLWLVAIWRAVPSAPDQPAVGSWFGVLAAVGLVAAQSVGLLVPLLGGAAQAIAGAVYARCLLGLWAVPAGIGLAAMVLPLAIGRPLYGHRLAVGAWVSWLVLVPMALARDLPPDLLQGWPARLVLACTVLQAVPGLLCLVLIGGTLVGEERRWPRGSAAFLMAGVVAASLGMLSDAALTAFVPRQVQFSAWSSAMPLPPLWPGPWLMAMGAGYLAMMGRAPSRWPMSLRRHLLVALAATAALVAVRGPQGLAEIAGGGSAWLAEGSSQAVRMAAGLMVPGGILLWLAAWVWFGNCVASPHAVPTSELRLPVVAAQALSGDVIRWAAVVAIALGLLVSIFVPLVLPATVTPSERSAARTFLPGSSRERGQAVYVAEGCAMCHTQRVRADQADQPYGPPTVPGDYGAGPAVAGERRWGPDLAWVGDRFPDRGALALRLAVHGPDGVPAFGWLFGADGATTDGDAVVDYLVGLASGEADPAR